MSEQTYKIYHYHRQSANGIISSVTAKAVSFNAFIAQFNYWNRCRTWSGYRYFFTSADNVNNANPEESVLKWGEIAYVGESQHSYVMWDADRLATA